MYSNVNFSALCEAGADGCAPINMCVAVCPYMCMYARVVVHACVGGLGILVLYEVYTRWYHLEAVEVRCRRPREAVETKRAADREPQNQKRAALLRQMKRHVIRQ